MKIPPKKSLGQHFLRSEKAIREIIEASNIQKGEAVLEVGPGEGVLTEALLSAGAEVIAVEKDRRAAEFLMERWKDGKIKIVEGDILEIDPGEIGLKKGKYQVVANIPYYITGILIRYLLENKVQPSAMTLLVQKEVAERIVARDPKTQSVPTSGKESLLSLSVKAYGEPRIISKVKAGSFVPAPKVDSAIIRIENIGPHKAGKNETKFWLLTKTAFNGKRKTISHTIGNLFEDKDKAFADCGLDPNERPENIHLDTWIKLASHVK